MNADEKRIALEFLADRNFYKVPEAEFIVDCGSHDANYLHKGLVLYRCELFAQFVRLKIHAIHYFILAVLFMKKNISAKDFYLPTTPIFTIALMTSTCLPIKNDKYLIR